MTTPLRSFVAVALTALLAAASTALAQTPTAFTYQGKLTAAAGAPVNAPTTLRFQLFNSAEGGTSLAGPITRNNVHVTDGLFTTDIDFGNVFQSGNDGWVEIAVLDSQGNATVLSPRQKITPTPLASGVVGLAITPGFFITDIDNTANPQDFVIFGDGTPDGYFSFVAGATGQLTDVTLRVNSVSPGTSYITVRLYNGGNIDGAQVGFLSQEFPTPSGAAEVTVDLTSLNFSVTAGQTYSISILSSSFFSRTLDPLPGTSGQFNGNADNWWFRTRVRQVTRVNRAVSATTAQALNASAISGLNDQELRLRLSTDNSHGIAWFGPGTPFRDTGFSPDGPVVFGYSGGGLGTSQNGAAVVALRWGSSGNVGIGTAAPGSNGYRLELPNTANPAGQGRANAWVTYSSRTYKHDIQTLTDPLSTLNRLRGVQFVWNEPLPDGTHKHDIGFIAEEVADAVPDLVTRTPDGAATGLDYGKVVPITVEAIKAQQATLSAQQAEIATLKATNAELKARLDRLEAMLTDLR